MSAAAARMQDHRPSVTPRRESPLAITGYASLFGHPDISGDTILPGAFRESLARRGAGGIRLLWQHDPGQPLGVWHRIVETNAGLLVHGLLLSRIGRAREVAALIGAGAVDGLSIGYRVQRASADGRSGRRVLRRIDLLEVSIVTFPMQPEARIVRPRSGSIPGAGRGAVSLRPVRRACAPSPSHLKGKRHHD